MMAFAGTKTQLEVSNVSLEKILPDIAEQAIRLHCFIQVILFNQH